MLKFFDRYLLKEISPPFFIGLLVYTFVLLMNQVFLLSELLFALGGWLVTSALTLYLAPWANFKWVQTLAKSVLSKVQLNINPREFNESVPGTVIFVQDITSDNKWQHTFVHPA